jgi:hypothetical protein
MSVREATTGRDGEAQEGWPYRIFVRRPAYKPVNGWAGRLINWLDLDVYADSLLGKKARVEMKTAALVLLLNFFFDFGAWTLLLNAALHSEVRGIDWWTPVAVIGGIVFATIILLYERQSI